MNGGNISVMANRIPCDESKHCFYEEYFGKSKYCRILTDRKGNAPYKDGKCMFIKAHEGDFSGGMHDGRRKKEVHQIAAGKDQEE